MVAQINTVPEIRHIVNQLGLSGHGGLIKSKSINSSNLSQIKTQLIKHLETQAQNPPIRNSPKQTSKKSPNNLLKDLITRDYVTKVTTVKAVCEIVRVLGLNGKGGKIQSSKIKKDNLDVGEEYYIETFRQ